MLKIEPGRMASGIVLQLEGRVVGPWVDELRETCESALRQGASLIVDLAGVAFVDREGLALLERLRHRDVVLANCSAFVSEQLRSWPP